jgi:hypothetical protein
VFKSGAPEFDADVPLTRGTFECEASCAPTPSSPVVIPEVVDDEDGGADDDGKYVLSVELHGKVERLPRNETQMLMRAAHKVCPYSNATRGNIDVKLIAD